MCRWIAYRGETIKLERYVTAPSHSLVVQSLRALEGNASTNGDGFGLGWYDAQDREPGLYREVRPAWSDENLRHLCRHIRSHLFFAHVRASTGTPTTRPNCHPFAFGKWLFMHNGQIGDWSLIRRRVEALIPDELYKCRIGTTDSEAVFLAILGSGAETDPITATMRTLDISPTWCARAARPSRCASPRRCRTAKISTRSATPTTTRRTRCITARQATTWSWCPSRSTPTARTGSWFRSATSSSRAGMGRSSCCRSPKRCAWRRSSYGRGCEIRTA
jgi:predicted glutamine amidotransferase